MFFVSAEQRLNIDNECLRGSDRGSWLLPLFWSVIRVLGLMGLLPRGKQSGLSRLMLAALVCPLGGNGRVDHSEH